MSKNKQDYLQIGEISKKTGIAVSALRYYEEVGLLMPDHKSENKYRYYKASDVSLALFIKKSQHLGFSLDEIKEILNERNEGRSPCPKVRKIAETKITELHGKIEDLKELEKELKEYITESHFDADSSPGDTKVCKMIDKVDL